MKQLNFSTPSMEFLSYQVPKNLIDSIKNDNRLDSLREYLNYNPSLVITQAKKYIVDNRLGIVFPDDITEIINNIKNFYEMHKRHLKEIADTIPEPDNESFDDINDEEGGIPLLPRKKLGGKSKRKRKHFKKKTNKKRNKKTLRKRYKKYK
jgi:hypothetical protein